MVSRNKSKSIDITEFKYLRRKNLAHFSLIDIRTQTEYEAGRIPGALSIPMEKLMKHQHQLNKLAHCIVYSQSGNRGYSAANWLANEGFENVYHLESGFNGWNGFKAHGHLDLNCNILPPDASFFEAIQMALTMEENLKCLYIELGEYCKDEKIRSVINKLAKFEDHHKAHLMKQYEIEDESQLKMEAFNEKHGKKLEGGGELEGNRKIFLKMIQKPEDFLKIGIGLEAQALDFYSRLSQKTNNKKSKDLFLSMMKEELTHLEYITRELNKYLIAV